jgi:putative hemolysin
MDITLWLGLGLLAALLGLSAFFSSSETSLFSLSAVQLEQMRRERNPRLKLIQNLLSKPRRLIVTILIGNELVNVAASVISAAIVIQIAGVENSWVNVLIMVPLLLLVGEITPKTLAIRHNIAFATFQGRYIELFARVITPLRHVVRLIADYFITQLVSKERSRGNILTEDMVRSLTKAAVGEGVLDRQEAKYIQQIFDFGDKTVRDVMTLRSQIFFLPASMSLSEMMAELRRTRHTKTPVYDGNKDSVIGILFARDLLHLDLAQRSPQQERQTLRKLLRRPYFVPESKQAGELFLTFRKRKLSIALTADEFGGVTGLVTMEDLLECIFGDIPSNSEQVKEQQVDLEVLGPNRYRVMGAMAIKQFNKAMKAGFAQSNADTMGGLLLNEIGEVPPEGARITIGEYTFTVVSVIGQRIHEITVQVESHRTPQDTESSDNSEAQQRKTD